MFATKMNSTTPANNRHSTFFWRRPVQGSTPPASSTPSQENQKVGASGNSSSHFPAPPPLAERGTAVLPNLNPNTWREMMPSSSSSSSRRSAAHNNNNSARAWTNPYQTLTACGRKRFQKLRQKISRAAEEDNSNSAIPSFLKILNVPANKQKVTRFFAAALERKAQKLKEKAMRQNGSMTRALYRGPKLNWMEIQALEKEADEEDGKQVDGGGNETGVSNVNEILQQTRRPISYHVPQVVMPGVQGKSDGDVNDGDTDPGTDTDNEGGDTDVEDEDKENVNPGSSVPRVQSPKACLPDRTAEPKTPINSINTCGPSAYRATVEEVIDDEGQPPRTPISARTQASSTEGIFAAPRKPGNYGEQAFPQVQSWHEPKPAESTFGFPSKSTSETIQLSADTGASLSSSKINAPRPSWQEQQQTQLPLPQSAFSSVDGPCTSQEQRPAGLSLNAFASTNAERQQTSESHQSYFTHSAQPTNLQQPCFSFPASQTSYLHVPSGNDTQPTAASQPMSQSVSPLPNAHPSMPQAFSNSAPEIPYQPQLFTQNSQSGFQQQAAFNWTFQQPAMQSVPSFQNSSFQSQPTSSQQPNTTAFQTQPSNSAGFPTLEATFAFFSIPQYPPAASRPIIRRLPVLAPDDPPNRPILFGPHGIQAFLKEKPIPVEEDAPLPPAPLDDFDCDAWNEKIKRRCEEFQARRRKSGPLGKLPPSPKKNYVGKPPRGSEEDLIRRLELQKKYEERKTKKRVRFLLPDETPRKKRRTEKAAKEVTLSPVIVPQKLQLSVRETMAEADPVVPGAYDIQWDDEQVVKWEKPRPCPSVTGLFSFLFGNSAAGYTQNEESPV